MFKKNTLLMTTLILSSLNNQVIMPAEKEPKLQINITEEDYLRIKKTAKRTAVKSIIAATLDGLKEYKKNNDGNRVSLEDKGISDLLKEIDLYDISKKTLELAIVDEIMPIENQKKLEKFFEMLAPEVVSHLCTNLLVKEFKNESIDAAESFFELLSKLLAKVIGARFLTRPGDDFYPYAISMATYASFLGRDGYDFYLGTERIALEKIKELVQNKSYKLNDRNRQKTLGKISKIVAKPFVHYAAEQLRKKNLPNNFCKNMAPIAISGFEGYRARKNR